MNVDKQDLDTLFTDNRILNALHRDAIYTVRELVLAIKRTRRGGYFFLSGIRNLGDLYVLRILMRLEEEGLITQEEHFGPIPSDAWKSYRAYDEVEALTRQRDNLLRKAELLDERIQKISGPKS